MHLFKTATRYVLGSCGHKPRDEDLLRTDLCKINLIEVDADFSSAATKSGTAIAKHH